MPTDAFAQDGGADTERDPCSGTSAARDRSALRIGLGVTGTFLIALLGDWTLAYLAPIFAAPMLQQARAPTAAEALKALLAVVLVSALCLWAATLSQILPAAFFVLLFPALYHTFRFGLSGGSSLIMLVALCGLMLTPMVAGLSGEAARDVARSFGQNIGLSLLVAMVAFALIPPDPSAPPTAPKALLPEMEVSRRAALLTGVTGSYAVLYFAMGWTNVHTPLYIAVYAWAMDLERGRLAATGILAANVAAGVLTMALYQLTGMAPYLPFIAVTILAVTLMLARMITSGVAWAPFAGFALSVLMILYGDTIQPFGDDGGSSFADRFGELFAAALWALGALALLQTWLPPQPAPLSPD